MTTPHPKATILVDPGNTLLSKSSFTMDTGSIETLHDGTLGVITLRTPSATLTLFLTAEELREWAQMLTSVADQVGGNGLAKATPQDLSLLTQLARRGRQQQ